jgi:dTMP kinase
VLIAIDGIYSVGKSTLIERVVSRLGTAADRPVMVSEWNSSDLVGGLIPAWKRDGRLGGHSLLFAEAADLAHRCEASIWPHLRSGGVLVADRYVLSGMARSVIRGVDPVLAGEVFGFAPREVLTILVECPPEVTLERRKRLGKRLGGYHSGRDYRRTASVEADFVRYQGEKADLYRRLAAERGEVLTVDTTCSLDDCVDRVMLAVGVCL